LSILGIAQAFKGTLDAEVVAGSLRRAIAAAGHSADVVLGSDGGDGLLAAVDHLLDHRTIHAVSGPFGGPVDAEVGWLDGSTAVIESRLACGLSLVDWNERDPMTTTTRGVGELMVEAVRAGAGTVFVGLGGSATMDAGLGMARAMGWGVLDAEGQGLPEGGGSMRSVARLVAGPAPGARIVGLADVAVPLLGPGGAMRFAAQKGAGPDAAVALDRGLARVVEAAVPFGGPAHAAFPGAGAAGGLGFGLLCFAGGELIPGAAWVLDHIGLSRRLAGAELVIVTEGAFDATSMDGKLSGEVIRCARAAGVAIGLVTPAASAVPPGVLVGEVGGVWDAEMLERRATALIARAVRLPPV